MATSLFEILQQRRGRVLFVSEKNSSRSQMAEAYARVLGEDVIEAASGGASPAPSIPHQTHAVMREKGVSLAADQSPKNFHSLTLQDFDVIVNLGGCRLPETEATVLELPLPAPVDDLPSHREVRERIETFVNFLVDHFRRAKEWNHGVEQASSAMPGSVKPSSVKQDSAQTSPVPTPAATPQPDAAMTAAS
ncbi:MAG TPA: hypothetical protein VGN17_24280 [Bryobacteraceae bacterium]